MNMKNQMQAILESDERIAMEEALEACPPDVLVMGNIMTSMDLIEKYQHKGEGYNPFLIREGWQVAQLNYVSGQGVNDIQKIDVHPNTDEVFILLAGKALLIAAEREGQRISYEMIMMGQGIVYNIRKGVWHNIAMSKDAQVLIIEKDNTHLNDFEYYYLDEIQRKELYIQIATHLKRP